ncbi:MAG: ATP-binding protein [Stackebrandtia sp.]
MRIALVPSAVVAVLAAATVVYITLDPPEPFPGATNAVLSAAIVGFAITAIVAVTRAGAAARSVHERAASLRSSIALGQSEIYQMAEQFQRGERPVPPNSVEPRPAEGGEFDLLAHDIDRYRQTAMVAVSQVSVVGPTTSGGGGASDERVGVFVNLARRLQSLVHREIQLLDDLEAQVEDPDLLKGLFSVDHLATRIRRHAENLAVLGGAVSRRQWSAPVNVYEVLRSAVAEVEHYARVKLVQPIEGTLQGHAVADVIHLVAELVENATKFSAPQTKVLLRAQLVTSGLAVEVEDRGLGMPREEQQRVNSMLAAPEQIDIEELLRDGRIGLFVVSTLARRHGVLVQLQTNIFGGVQAVVVLPVSVLGDDPRRIESAKAAPAAQEPAAVEARQDAAITAEPSPSPRPARATASVPVAAPSSGPPAPDPHAADTPHPVAVAVDDTRDQTEALPAMERESPPPAEVVFAVDAPAPRLSDGPEAGSLPWPPETAGAQPTSYGRLPSPTEDRPRLPRRQRQAHMAPELTRAPANVDEPVSGHNPGLMSAFQQGVNRADSADEDGGHGDPLNTAV